MNYAEHERLSPNFSASPPHERRGVLIHHTVLDLEETLRRLLDPSAEVSYHVVVARSGERFRLVPDERVAWHAGRSEFQGRSGCNFFLLGLGFEGDTYRAPLTQDQIASALEWMAPRWTAHGWSTGWIIDHRQVAPGRKDDLNPAEWARFHAAVRDRFAGPAAPA